MNETKQGYPISKVIHDAPRGRAETAIHMWGNAVDRENVVYRAQFKADGSRVNVLSLMPLDMKITDRLPDGDYALDDLPDWFRRRLDALAIIPATPPQQDIGGVGRRVVHLTYWVYR